MCKFSAAFLVLLSRLVTPLCTCVCVCVSTFYYTSTLCIYTHTVTVYVYKFSLTYSLHTYVYIFTLQTSIFIFPDLMLFILSTGHWTFYFPHCLWHSIFILFYFNLFYCFFLNFCCSVHFLLRPSEFPTGTDKVLSYLFLLYFLILLLFHSLKRL